MTHTSVIPTALAQVALNAAKRALATVEAPALSEREQIAFEQCFAREFETALSQMLASSVESAVQSAVTGFLSKLFAIKSS